jgi:epoxyqueuosine reductase QueG
MLDRVTAAIARTVGSPSASIISLRLWRPPITGFVSASRSEFHRLKDIVSRNHLLPQDVLPDAKSVICFFIPFAEEIAKSNIGGRGASREWAQAYVLTNALISNISAEIERLMNENGFSVGKIPATHNFDTVTLVSN